MDESELPNYIYTKCYCPHCNKLITIPRCSYCKHVDGNYFNYTEAYHCWSCDMLHKNFEYNGGIDTIKTTSENRKN